LFFLVPEAGVAFTTRPGGFSDGPYKGLNLSYYTGDDRACVTANRLAVSRALGISPEWASVNQVHGTRTVRADASDPAGLGERDADAIVTSVAGLPIAVLVADCLPIALVGTNSSSVVHAGWRGLCSGVIESAVEELGETEPRAWIGPSVGPCHYQVGPRVIERFRAAYPESPVFWEGSEADMRFDLAAAGRWVLRKAGAVVEDHEPVCTSCDERFFSYRREGNTGRQAVLVWR
jgi:YfiH family protein